MTSKRSRTIAKQGHFSEESCTSDLKQSHHSQANIAPIYMLPDRSYFSSQGSQLGKTVDNFHSLRSLHSVFSTFQYYGIQPAGRKHPSLHQLDSYDQSGQYLQQLGHTIKGWWASKNHSSSLCSGRVSLGCPRPTTQEKAFHAFILAFFFFL